MEFVKIELLNLLWVIVPLCVLFIVYYSWQKNIIEHKFDYQTFSKINPNYSGVMKILHFSIKIFAILFLVFSLAGPKLGTKLTTVKREGVDVIFALDVSKSMLVEDVAPSRLLKSIQIISKAIDNLIADRLGLIVYAGDSYPLMPLTFDYSMAKLLVNTIDTDIVSSQGTDLGSAISLANTFFNNDQRSKILFIISDGEDHQDDYDRQIDQLSNQNIIVCSINVGTRSGGPIPIKNKSNVNYKLDNSGEVVISKSNSEILKKIASLGGGQFIKTQNTDEATSFIIENIKVLDKTLQEEKVYSEYEHQFQWFLSVALLFILIDLILTNKRINFIDKIIR